MLLFTMQMFRCGSVTMSHQTVDCDKRTTSEWRLQLLPGSRPHFCRGCLVSAAQHGAPPPNPSIPAGCHARKKGPLLHNRYGIKMIEKCVSPLQGSQRSRKIPGLCQRRYGKEGALGALCPIPRPASCSHHPQGHLGYWQIPDSWSGMNLFPALSDFLGLILILHASDGAHLSLGLGGT